MNMKLDIIKVCAGLIIVLALLMCSSVGTETTWRHSGFEVWGYDINFTDHNASNINNLTADYVNVSSLEVVNVSFTGNSNSTYEKIIRVSASKLGTPPTNPPTVDVYNITHVLEFTVNTDKAYLKHEIPHDHDKGNISIHLHWTKSTTNDDQSTKNVNWSIKYQVINSSGDNCNSGYTTATIEDTYDSAVTTSQIIYETDAIVIPHCCFSPDQMVMFEVMAYTPSTNALDDEPALVWGCIKYNASHIVV